MYTGTFSRCIESAEHVTLAQSKVRFVIENFIFLFSSEKF